MMLFLEWGGSAAVLVGYALFAFHRNAWGAAASVMAGLLLATWAALAGAYGVMAMNAVVVLINAVTVLRHESQSRNRLREEENHAHTD